MSHLAPLISDLALILLCAGIITLIFKKTQTAPCFRVYCGGLCCQSSFFIDSLGY